MDLFIASMSFKINPLDGYETFPQNLLWESRLSVLMWCPWSSPFCRPQRTAGMLMVCLHAGWIFGLCGQAAKCTSVSFFMSSSSVVNASESPFSFFLGVRWSGICLSTAGKKPLIRVKYKENTLKNIIPEVFSSLSFHRCFVKSLGNDRGTDLVPACAHLSICFHLLPKMRPSSCCVTASAIKHKRATYGFVTAIKMD